MKNKLKRRLLMIKMSVTYLSGGGEKRAEIIRKSGYFHHFGVNCYWHPIKIPADLSVVSIGDNVTVCTDVDFVTHDLAHRLFNLCDDYDTTNETITYYFDKIIVDDNVMIGAHSVIMPGVHIHSNAIVAAGAVVTKDVEAGTVVGGCPAKPIGKTKELFEKRRKLQQERQFGNNDLDAINQYFWNDR